MQLHLSQLKLTQFKNYEQKTLSLVDGINGFTGKNGIGKTNLLDAIYYLCMTKSFFGGTDRYLALHDTDFFRLEGKFIKNDVPFKVVAKVVPGKEKTMEINGSPSNPLSEHIGQFKVVVVAPSDTQLATEGSEYRRKLMDNTLCQLDGQYLGHLMAYNRLLNTRNAALKMMAQQHRFNGALIDTYDQQMVTPTQYIFEKRKSFVSDFQPMVQTIYQQLSDDAETIEAQLKSPLESQSMEEILLQNREKDKILQRTSSGVHRDDLQLLMDGMPVKRFGSQGQLKSFVISLKLAQYAIMSAQSDHLPILLLDDVFDKLDPRRVENLLTSLSAGPYGQVFITDTYKERMEHVMKAFDQSQLISL